MLPAVFKIKLERGLDGCSRPKSRPKMAVNFVFLETSWESDLLFSTGQLVRVEVVSEGSSHGQDPWESFVERSPRIYCTIEMICA